LSSHGDDRPRRKRARIEAPELPYAALIKNACLTVGVTQKAGEEGADEENTAPKPLTPDELRKGLLKTMFDIASGEDTKESSRKRMYRAWKDAIELAGDVPHEGVRER
jgi:ribosomal RNA-processing protein 1